MSRNLNADDLDMPPLHDPNPALRSPIDLNMSVVQQPPTASGNIRFQSGSFIVENVGYSSEAIAVDPLPGHVIADGFEYPLVRFHVHVPSEHRFDGENFPMELHLVHQDDEENKIVLAVMLVLGNPNQALDEYFSVTARELTDTGAQAQLVKAINTSDLIPHGSTFIEYAGSLTRPPHTPGVRWWVFRQPLEVSAEQVQLFTSVHPDDLPPVEDHMDRPLIEREFHSN